ncbi:MAG: hypothetical protein JNM72_02200 [Deltaproteobacteria bacterium]|nr:hypothetical protein [Deltaproteobacteria bacterium]
MDLLLDTNTLTLLLFFVVIPFLGGLWVVLRFLAPAGPAAPQVSAPAAPLPAPAPAASAAPSASLSPSTSTMVALGLPTSGRAAPTAAGEVEPPLRLLGPAPAGRRLEGNTGPAGLREPLGAGAVDEELRRLRRALQDTRAELADREEEVERLRLHERALETVRAEGRRLEAELERVRAEAAAAAAGPEGAQDLLRQLQVRDNDLRLVREGLEQERAQARALEARLARALHAEDGGDSQLAAEHESLSAEYMELSDRWLEVSDENTRLRAALEVADGRAVQAERSARQANEALASLQRQQQHTLEQLTERHRGEQRLLRVELDRLRAAAGGAAAEDREQLLREKATLEAARERAEAELGRLRAREGALAAELEGAQAAASASRRIAEDAVVALKEARAQLEVARQAEAVLRTELDASRGGPRSTERPTAPVSPPPRPGRPAEPSSGPTMRAPLDPGRSGTAPRWTPADDLDDDSDRELVTRQVDDLRGIFADGGAASARPRVAPPPRLQPVPSVDEDDAPQVLPAAEAPGPGFAQAAAPPLALPEGPVSLRRPEELPSRPAASPTRAPASAPRAAPPPRVAPTPLDEDSDHALGDGRVEDLRAIFGGPQPVRPRLGGATSLEPADTGDLLELDEEEAPQPAWLRTAAAPLPGPALRAAVGERMRAQAFDARAYDPDELDSVELPEAGRLPATVFAGGALEAPSGEEEGPLATLGLADPVEWGGDELPRPEVDLGGQLERARGAGGPLSPAALDAAAMVFDGTVQRVVQEDAFEGLSGPGFTFEGWLRPGRSDRKGTLMSYVARRRTCVAIYIESRGGPPALSVVIDGEHTPLRAAVPLRPGQWQHVAFTWNAATGNLSVLVDGQERYVGALAGGARIPGAGRVVIGQDCHALWDDLNPGLSLVGELAELRVWRYSRSVEEVAAARLDRPAPSPHVVIWRRA